MNTHENGRFLCFSLGEEEFAIPLLKVKEVIAIPEVTQLPHSPAHFLGIMNLRGQVISVVDLRMKLGIKGQTTAETAVIICDLSPYSIGIVIDSVNSVLTPKAEDVSDKPDIQGHKAADYILSVYRRDSRMILFLDIAKILNVEDHAIASKNSGSAKAA